MVVVFVKEAGLGVELSMWVDERDMHTQKDRKHCWKAQGSQVPHPKPVTHKGPLGASESSAVPC